MKQSISTVLLLCIVAAVAVASSPLTPQEDNYEGYKIYDVDADNGRELLLQLSKYENYDFFKLPKQTGEKARVMVSPEEQKTFEETLEKFGLTYEIINENVEESIKLSKVQNALARSSRAMNGRISFETFHRFDEINSYLDSLAKQYPNRVSVKTVGKSFEGRNQKTITITNGDGKKDKKVILLDAGIHAREWIAPAEALYVIDQLVENFEENKMLLQDYDWVILPVVNPDGYEYTHTTRRMWRKTRKPVTTTCTGTDGNRNFDFHWGGDGASSIACADDFKGKSAFSEPETQILRDLMHSLSGRGKMYLTLHSYGNYLLYPWGYTEELPETWRDLDEVARAGAEAIKSATKTKYSVGSSTNVLYAAAGGSDDYAFGKADFPISITMELPAGGSGFDPTPQQLRPFVEETWIGIKAMAKKVIEKY